MTSGGRRQSHGRGKGGRCSPGRYSDGGDNDDDGDSKDLHHSCDFENLTI